MKNAVRHSPALGMNRPMPHAAWRGADDGVRTRRSGTGGVGRPVERIRDLLADTYRERHSLRSLSREAALHPIYLLQAFKRRFGVTPAAFLRTQRVARAKHFIHAGLGLAAVANEAGFCDQSHLTRCFKRTLGVTPGVYADAIAREGARTANRA